MNNTENQQPGPRQRIITLIRDRFREAEERDDQGRAIVALPASDKLALAKQADVDFAEFDDYLNSLCEEVKIDERRAAVPRYRLAET
jgi:hypothetical protein